MALVVIAAVVLLQLLIANSDMTGAMGRQLRVWARRASGTGVDRWPRAGRDAAAADAGHGVGHRATTAAATSASGAAASAGNASWFVIRWVVASALGGPLLMTAIALAVIHDASSVLTELQTPHALRAFGGVLAVHAVGA